MTTSRVRVLVVEDSATSRELLVQILGSDPQIEVVGEAANGAAAVEAVRRLQPSVVVMDIQMPVMDGFEATKRIMVESPTPIIIVTSNLDPLAVEVSLRAVRLGALTVVPKPPAPSSAGFRAAAERLTTLTKALSEVAVVRRRWLDDVHSGDVADTRRPVPSPSSAGRMVIAVAASTGGPAAVYRLLELLPGETAAPVLVVQHIAEGFVPGLVVWLGTGTELPVKLAEHGERACAGTVYVAPDDQHLEVDSDWRIVLSTAPPRGGFRPSADALFASAARVAGRAAVAVVLTGMGTDGLDGVRAVRQAGGVVLAQDEDTSAVFGMPGAVIDAGAADVVGPVEELASEICTLTRRGR